VAAGASQLVSFLHALDFSLRQEIAVSPIFSLFLSSQKRHGVGATSDGALCVKASLPPKPLSHLEWLETDALPPSNFVTAAMELAMMSPT
jgi:hypothetical protein